MHFVYHPEHEPRIVNSAEYQKLLANGWYDTPAKFPIAEVVEEPKAEAIQTEAAEVKTAEPVIKKAVKNAKK
jgi:hypothetical protein